MTKYSIGLDFGTNSVRTLIVEVGTGKELSSNVWNYKHGESGVILDSKNPFLARQHPGDYIQGIEYSVRGALKEAKRKYKIKSENIIGIGVDTTGSTPIPVDEKGIPLALHKQFYKEPSAMAWLWKDHTGYAEAGEITGLAKKIRPHYLAKCGGTYSSEWFWSKMLHCARTNPKVFNASYTWVELADWIPAILTGTENPKILKRGICAAGHKAMFNPHWKGYPDSEFLNQLDKRLGRIRSTLPDKAYTIADIAGILTGDWAKKLDLPSEIPVAIGAFDAHLGGVGSGIQPGVLVKIIGTSTCDMMIAPLNKSLPDIPGLCGIVPESILPDYYGMEAGQSGVGDIFNWFVNIIRPEKDRMKN